MKSGVRNWGLSPGFARVMVKKYLLAISLKEKIKDTGKKLAEGEETTSVS